MATCRTCQAEIKFIRTEKGRQMPCEPKPVTVITSLGKTIKAFVPHWGNCSGATNHRKPRTVDPDNRAAYAHHNEDADRIRYAENPEIFGR